MKWTPGRGSADYKRDASWIHRCMGFILKHDQNAPSDWLQEIQTHLNAVYMLMLKRIAAKTAEETALAEKLAAAKVPSTVPRTGVVVRRIASGGE